MLFSFDKQKRYISYKSKSIPIYLVVFFIYIVVWLVWGFIYRDIANKTSGEAFIFQQDILDKVKIRAFRETTKTKASDDVILSLIKNGEYKRLGYVSPKKIGNRIIAFSKDVIGVNWAKFYEDDLYGEGIRYYTINIDRSNLSLNNSDFNELFSVIHINLYAEINRSKNVKYKNNDVIKCESNTNIFERRLKNIKKSQTYKYEKIKGIDFIIFRKNDILNKINDLNSGKILKFGGDNEELADAEDIFQYIISQSSSFMGNGDTVKKLENCVKGLYNYPLIDFIYFSAITITTTGYGDIIPKSSEVRAWVMIESIFGVLLPGLFLSLLFKDND